MVKRDEEWHLHNTRKKDIELLQEMGFTPSGEIQQSIKKASVPGSYVQKPQ